MLCELHTILCAFLSIFARNLMKFGSTNDSAVQDSTGSHLRARLSLSWSSLREVHGRAREKRRRVLHLSRLSFLFIHIFGWRWRFKLFPLSDDVSTFFLSLRSSGLIKSKLVRCDYAWAVTIFMPKHLSWIRRCVDGFGKWMESLLWEFFERLLWHSDLSQISVFERSVSGSCCCICRRAVPDYIIQSWRNFGSFIGNCVCAFHASDKIRVASKCLHAKKN